MTTETRPLVCTDDSLADSYETARQACLALNPASNEYLAEDAFCVCVEQLWKANLLVHQDRWLLVEFLRSQRPQAFFRTAAMLARHQNERAAALDLLNAA